MIPMVSIVGKSDSGKTTLLEKLIRELTDRGYKIASIKHDAHSFEIDHEGKDSWRHKKAGAVLTLISSASKIAMVLDSDHDHTMKELRDKFIKDVDLILAEGYKREDLPKIEVFRSALRKEMLCSSQDNLIAVAGDPSSVPPGTPVFDLDDPKVLADFIEEKFLTPEKPVHR
ncbi:MAG: molybdopterin-guanine dinucleotide biosynthesis protein B [Deltaproteobacteria bacterium]|nr:molybdopterin-guanine dinucleotide biosynthesis protein B [Deltaproteobacteria bacterium]